MSIWHGENCLDNVPEGVKELYGVVLNPMPANAERGNLMAVAIERSELVDWVRGELAAEPYKDGPWHKVFRKGSPLEWMNLPVGKDIEALNGPADEDWGHGVIKLELVPQWVRTQ